MQAETREALAKIAFEVIDKMCDLVWYVVLLSSVVLVAYLLGWLFSLLSAAIDARWLHWHLPAKQWRDIGTYGLLVWFVVATLHKFMKETVNLLLRCGLAVAAVAWVASVVTTQAFLPLCTSMATWCLPVAFVLWLGRCADNQW